MSVVSFGKKGILLPLGMVFLVSLISTINAQQTFVKQPVGPIVIENGVVDLQGNYYQWYGFDVPPDATDAVLTGTYEVHGGLISQVDFYVLDRNTCSLSDLQSNSCITLLRESKSLGQVNISLAPGNYYAVFYNTALLGESKQTKVLLELSYNQLVPQGNIPLTDANVTPTEDQQLQASIAQEQAEFGHYTCQQLSDLLDQWEAIAGSMDNASRLKLAHASDQYIVRCESTMPRYSVS